MEGKFFYGMSDLKLYEATPSSETKLDPNGHLTTSSNGLRLSPFSISTQAITANAIDATAITASAGMRSLGIIDAAGITVQQQGSTGKLQISNQRITGVTNLPAQDDEVANKLYVDGKVKKVMLIHTLRNAQALGKVQGWTAYNSVGNYSNGDLTLSHDSEARLLINITRKSNVGNLSFTINYIEQGKLINLVIVHLDNGQGHTLAMDLLSVKKNGVLQVIANDAFTSSVSVRIEVTLK